MIEAMDSTNKAEVYKDIKERINNYFEAAGKSRKADHVLYIKMLFFSLLPITGYIILLTVGVKSLPAVYAGYLIFTIGLTLFVITVAHDASHHALLNSRSGNNILSYSWNFLGISKCLWEIKHHYSHHTYTNIPHKDVDISESPLIRFSPFYPYRAYYKYQYLYAPFLYFLFGIFITYVKDFIMFFNKNFKSHGRDKLPRHFFVQLLFTKLLFLLISFIIPLMVLPFPFWKILAIYLFSLALSGSLILLVLIVPHINEDAALYEPDYSIKKQNDWALLQIRTTVDSSVNSRLINWLTGGLNTHLAHHLFPNICHVHYMQITKIIKQVLSERGIRYKEKNFFLSLSDHFRFLKLMGMRPAEFQKLKHYS